jgi:fructose-1,6-bisphosphatase I
MLKAKKLRNLTFLQTTSLLELSGMGISCTGVGSEENDNIVVFDDPRSRNSNCIMLMDPLDGRGNINVKVSIG